MTDQIWTIRFHENLVPGKLKDKGGVVGGFYDKFQFGSDVGTKNSKKALATFIDRLNLF